MTAKEYLGQAYRLDQRIDSKLLQVESLDSMAKKATATLSDMPFSSAHRSITFLKAEPFDIKIKDSFCKSLRVSFLPARWLFLLALISSFAKK